MIKFNKKSERKVYCYVIERKIYMAGASLTTLLFCACNLFWNWYQKEMTTFHSFFQEIILEFFSPIMEHFILMLTAPPEEGDV